MSNALFVFHTFTVWTEFTHHSVGGHAPVPSLTALGGRNDEMCVTQLWLKLINMDTNR